MQMWKRCMLFLGSFGPLRRSAGRWKLEEARAEKHAFLESELSQREAEWLMEEGQRRMYLGGASAAQG